MSVDMIVLYMDTSYFSYSSFPYSYIAHILCTNYCLVKEVGNETRVLSHSRRGLF